MPRKNQINTDVFNKHIQDVNTTDEYYLDRSKKRLQVYVKCYCIYCNKEMYISSYRLRHNKSSFCLCHKEIARRKTKLYHVYHGMLQRCYNSNNPKWNIYGGKGIKVCDEWISDYEIFKEWAYNNGYKDGLTIDRIDSNKNYEPSNCQWITLSENSVKSNIGKHKNHTKIGKIVSIKDNKCFVFNNIKRFANMYGLNPSGIRNCVLCIGFKNHTYRGWEFYKYDDFDFNKLEGVTTIESIIS